MKTITHKLLKFFGILAFIGGSTVPSLAQYQTDFEVATRDDLIGEGWTFLGYSLNTNANARSGTKMMRSAPNASSVCITPMLALDGSDTFTIWFRSSNNSNLPNAFITISVEGGSSAITQNGITNGWQSLTLNTTETGAYQIRITTNTVSHGAQRAFLDDYFGTADLYVVTLPVVFIDFAGQYSSGKVALHWATALEENNSHFEVMRSADGLHFEKIGQVDGAGSSNTRQDYYFLDTDMRAGGYYYQIVQVDEDGTRDQTAVIYVANEEIAALNPTVQVFDLQGRFLFKGTKQEFLQQALTGQVYIVQEAHRRYKMMR
ncbi:MAG: hypothetical protein OHK0053_04450 [Microscillaceae bacterium]